MKNKWNQFPILCTGGSYCAVYNPSTDGVGLGGGVLGHSWAEVPCHETVILPAIKVTSIHYWKWLPTLQTHLGECTVIREFVGEGRGARVEGGAAGGAVTVRCPPQLTEAANIGSDAAVCGLGVTWGRGRWIMGQRRRDGGPRLPGKIQVSKKIIIIVILVIIILTLKHRSQIELQLFCECKVKHSRETGRGLSVFYGVSSSDTCFFACFSLCKSITGISLSPNIPGG